MASRRSNELPGEISSDEVPPADAPPRRRLGRVSKQLISKDLGRYSGLGCQLGATLLVFALGGYWLDRWFGTLPLFLILGTLSGFLGGTLSIVRKVPTTTVSSSTGDAPPTAIESGSEGQHDHDRHQASSS